MMPLTYRLLTATDLQEILTIEKSAHIAPWDLHTFQECLRANYENCVMQMNNKIIGYYLMSYGAGEGHIQNICIDVKEQGKGFGKLLLKHLLSRAKLLQIEMVLLEVRKSNIAAQKLYEKFGFNMIGERPNYYPTHHGREDALMYAMDLRLIEQ